MRGINKSWLALIVLLVGMMMPSVATAQASCEIFVDPAVVHNEDMALTEFTVDINVSNVVDLYAYAFTLDFQPYSVMLVASQATEGPFLASGGYPTDFTFKFDHFAGEVKVGNAILGPYPGVSGSGTIASIKLSVVEAGTSPLDLIKVELYDSNGTLMPCDVTSGMYSGPSAEVTWAYMKGWWWWPFLFAGDTTTANSWVCSYADVPLNVRVRFDLIRWDGRLTQFYAGQSYRTEAPDTEYLYCNGFTADYVEWGTTGVSPYLDAPDDGNYITGSSDAAFMAWFDFEDIALAGRIVESVTLEGYTDGPYNEGIDYDTYDQYFNWIGSLYGNGAPAWVTPRWVDAAPASEINTELMTEAGINAFQILMYFYDPDGLTLGNDHVDCLRLKVVFASVDPLEPPTWVLGNRTWMNLDTGNFTTTEDDVGFYRGTAVCEFTYNDLFWIEGKRERRIWLWVWKPWPWW